jgi:hypothetical protein
MNRDFNRSERFQRESSNNDENFNRQSTGRKRVFTEEPPSHKRARRSPSPKQSYDQNRDYNENKDEETRVKATSTSNAEFVKYPERKETTYSTDRHFVKSEVKSNAAMNEEFESKKNRNNVENNSSQERRNDKRHNESPFDLKDIPLPNTNDSIKVCINFAFNHFYLDESNFKLLTLL